MSKCQIEILPDHTKKSVFHPGDTVNGIVRITAFKDMDAKEFSIELEWRTHGAGNVDSHQFLVHSEDPEAWAKDEKHEVLFSFVLPEGPVTHSGNLVNIDWIITGKINLGWFSSVTNSVRLMVQPNPNKPRQIRKASRTIRSLEQTGNLKGFIPGFFTIALAIGALGIAGSQFDVEGLQTAIYTSQPIELINTYWLPLLLTALAPFLLFVGFWIIGRTILQNKRLGNVVITATSDPEIPGGINAHILHEPGGTLEVISITAFLDYRETATSGSGTTESTQEMSKTISSVRVDGPLTLLPEKSYENNVQLQVPPNGTTSFQSTHNEVAWIVGVELEIKGRQTVTRETGVWVI